jgi:hypothetical protein
VSLSRARATLSAAEAGRVMRAPLFVLIVASFAILFFAAGLFARPNYASLAVVVPGAASVARDRFVVMEFDRSFEGLLALPDAPLRQALAVLEAS